MQTGFTIEVDGKVYGPLPDRQRKKFSYLQHRKGVEFRDVSMEEAQGTRHKGA